MILSFKERFVGPIKAGTKIHSFRVGDRWEEGCAIHFYVGARTKWMHKIKDDGVCKAVQPIKIQVTVYPAYKVISVSVRDHSVLNGEPYWRTIDAELFAKLDGFTDMADLIEYVLLMHGEGTLEGQLIHWTDFKY